MITGGAEKLLLDSLPLYQEYQVEVDILLLDATQSLFLKELKTNFNGKILTSKYSNLYNPLQIFEIQKYFKDYDLINVHLFPSLYWAAIAKRIYSNKSPLIFTEHSTDNRRINSSILAQLDKMIYTNYAKIIAITPQVKQKLVANLGIDENKIRIIYNGINTRKYYHSNAIDKKIFFSAPNVKLLIQISNFHNAKDQKTVIRALTHLPNNYCLLLVGDGKLKNEYEMLTKELKLEHRVTFLGNRIDIPILLKTSDIVIQSSNWEGFGLAAVEGMASGKPVIASNVPGLSEIIKDAGLSFEKGNYKELAKKIISLEDEDYYKQIANSCLQRAKEFDIKKMIESYICLYKEVLYNW